MTERRPTPILSYGENIRPIERYTYTERGQEFIPPLPNGQTQIEDMPPVEIAAHVAAAREQAKPAVETEANSEKSKIQEMVDTTYVLASIRDQVVERQALNAEDTYGLAA